MTRPTIAMVGVWAAVLAGGPVQAAAAEAPARGGQGWSVLAGQTVGQGASVVLGELGWPGLSAAYLQGVTPTVDVGGRFTFNYGVEGIVTQVTPGVKLQGLVRVSLAEQARFNLGVTFAPGPFFYFYNGFTAVGLTLPVGLVAGIPVSSALMLHAGMEFPFYVLFGSGGGPVFPVLVGAGAEYYLDHRLSLSFNTRMGPSVTGSRSSPFTLEALLGVAYRL